MKATNVSMVKQVEIKIIPEKIEDHAFIEQSILQAASWPMVKSFTYQLIRKSIDSRQGRVLYVLRYDIWSKDEGNLGEIRPISYPNVADAKEILIIGSGPCGLYAALRCLELGLKPIVLERGKDVQSRRRDLRAIQQFGIVHPDSNYCFGEGGAGTYSDGKLYTRATKRGDIQKALEVLVNHGAERDILSDAHPHIGSNKLPKIIAAIRETIQSRGGEVRFGQKVVDFITDNGSIRGLTLHNGEEVFGEATILCTGHSARDIYQICDKHKISMDFKPFAMGVRIEHPQALIDQIQYHRATRGDYLPAAAYGLACQVDTHGVFSFCMCPGGLIVPASTSPGELVVNGMSLSRRDSPFANAAMVVTLDENPGKNLFDGLHYQAKMEQDFFNRGDGTQKAPAQRVTDFVAGRVSADLPDCSYIPGIYSAPMHEMLPKWISKAIKNALFQFDKKLKGYYTEEAQFVGLESRTSAPIRINRDRVSLMSPSIQGLFPGGEGAGFAGGILSAALDGEKLANAVHSFVSTMENTRKHI